MNLYRPKQLADSMRTVGKNAILIAEDIPEENHGYWPTADSRTVAETFLHIVAVSQLTYHIHGIERGASIESFDFGAFLQGPSINEKRTSSKSHIIAFVRTEGEPAGEWVEELPESLLAEAVGMSRGSPSGVGRRSRKRDGQDALNRSSGQGRGGTHADGEGESIMTTRNRIRVLVTGSRSGLERAHSTSSKGGTK